MFLCEIFNALPPHLLLLLIFAPIVGLMGMLAGGYWGVGCGWLVVPSMLILGFSPFEAIGIGLLQMAPSTIPTVLRQLPEIGWEKQQPGRLLVLPLGIGALLGSLCGKPLNGVLFEVFGTRVLSWMLIGMISLIALQTLFSKAKCYQDAMPQFGGKKSFLAGLAGLAAGILSSLLGLGGGIVIRPVLNGAFHVPEYYTGRIVRLLVSATTICGGITYLFSEQGFQWKILAYSMLVASGGFIGFPLGSKLHQQVYDNGYAQHIHKSFALVTGAVLLNTLLNELGYAELSRYLMLLIALAIFIYLLLFARYSTLHPKMIPVRPSEAQK